MAERVADDAPEAAVLAQLAAENPHFAQRLLTLGRLLQQDAQTLRIDRLGQIVVGAILDGFDRGLDSALRGQQDHRDLAHLLPQRPQQRQAVHARHIDVGDDDAGAEGGDALKRLFAIGGRIGHVAPRAHELGQTKARGPVVLDDEDTLGGCPIGAVDL